MLVHGARPTLERAFEHLVALQPVRWEPGGLVCAPRAAVDIARAALADLRFAVTALPHTAGWPDPAAEMVADWYRRSPDHLPAPPGVRELIQVPGEAFGWGGHHTTAMCLEALEDLPDGPALDAGCGSGLLTQAWLRLGRGPVLAVDAEAAAATQTMACLAASDLGADATVECRGIETLTADEISGRVILANVPEPVHWILREKVADHMPAAVLISGLRPGAAHRLVGSYRRLGLRPVRAMRRGRWECWMLSL